MTVLLSTFHGSLYHLLFPRWYVFTLDTGFFASRTQNIWSREYTLPIYPLHGWVFTVGHTFYDTVHKTSK